MTLQFETSAALNPLERFAHRVDLIRVGDFIVGTFDEVVLGLSGTIQLDQRQRSKVIHPRIVRIAVGGRAEILQRVFIFAREIRMNPLAVELPQRKILGEDRGGA